MRYLLLIIFLLFNTVHASETSVVINEIMPHPASGEDWIELYNSTAQTVDLTGWTVSDSTSTIKTLSGTLAPSGLLIVNLTNRLNNGGDSVVLKDTQQVVTDQYSYSSDPGIDQSIARVPDGGSWPSNSPSPSPTSSSSPAPTTSPSASNSPTPSPTSLPSPMMNFNLSQNSFSEDQELSISINLSHFPAQTTYYIKGAFFKDGSTNYFGKSLVSNNWVRNLQTYSEQLSITTDQNGSWGGTIKITVDKDDSGFSGPGSYQLKIGRYTDSGQGPNWSNSQTINITAAPIVVSPSPSTSSSAEPVSVSLKKPVIATSAALPASILGIGTDSAKIQPLPTNTILIEPEQIKNQFNQLLFWSGLGLVIAGSGLLLFLSTKHPTIAAWYGKLIVQLKHNKLLQTWLNKYWPKNQIMRQS